MTTRTDIQSLSAAAAATGLVAEFAARRRAVAEAIGPGGTAVVAGLGESGAFDVFRQTNDFYYLCGVEVPGAYLAIEGATARSVLYLPPRDEKHERSEGPQLNCDQPGLVRQATGVDDARPRHALGADLRRAAAVWTPLQPGEGRQACRDVLTRAARLNAADPWAQHQPAEMSFRQRLESSHPEAGPVRDLSPVLDRLRIHKSASELALMRRAGRLAAAGVTEAMRSTRPGVREYALAAVADYVFLVNGARGGGYRAIVAGGANAWNAHYYRNGDVLREGDLVLMDYAPDHQYYTSDIGRMWPANGRYTAAQRELYGFIVEYHKTLLRLIRPGVTAAHVMREAAAAMEPLVSRTTWSKPAYEAAARKALSFPGHLSHGVGMSVHDAGDYRSERLAPGVVFAVDPQMWVPQEQLYVRVEDTVAVTANGIENLTAAAPLELDEVEATIGSGGMLQDRPPLEG